MDTKSVYLLYANANEEVATDICDYFHQSNVSLFRNPTKTILQQKIEEDANTPILVLISDNFLRSIEDMDRLSILIQESNNLLIPVLVNGKRLRPNTIDIYESYPTRIGVVHEVMQYRDYWYEEWIRLRKACNNATGAELQLLEDQKNIAKYVSTNIGTFLRNINALKPKTLEAFAAVGYKSFLDEIGVEKLIYKRHSEHLSIVRDQPETSTEKEILLDIRQQPKTMEKSSDVEENLEELDVEKEVEAELQEEDKSIEEAISADKLVEDPLEKEIVKGEDLKVTLEETITLEKDGNESFVQESVELSDHERESKLEDVEHLKEEERERLDVTALEKETIEHDHTKVVDEEEDEAKEKVEDEHKGEFSMRSLNDLDDFDENLVYENVVLEEVQDLDVLFYLAETEAEEGDIDNAIHCYERILNLDPANGRAMLALARLISHQEIKDNAKIADLYQNALFCNEESPAIYYEYALFLKNEYQSLHRSSDLLYRAIALDPSFELAYLALADCQGKLGQKEQARANYLQACLLNECYRSTEQDEAYGVVRPQMLEEEVVVEEEAMAAKSVHPNSEKVVMVTGATSGIGKAIAEIFALNGYKLIITGRRMERLQAFKEQLADKFEVNIQLLSFDLRDKNEVAQAVNSLADDWKNIDILINNAGLAKGRMPIHEGELEHWETMIDTNLKGLLYLTRLVAPKMVANGKGFILNIGSVAGKEAYTNGNVYCATKAAVDMLTKAMRLDLHKHAVRVAAIHPGHVETEFALVRFDGNEEKANIYDNFSPLTAYDVAEVVYFVITRPARVNIQDVLMFSNQQASATVIDTSGRKFE